MTAQTAMKDRLLGQYHAAGIGHLLSDVKMDTCSMVIDMQHESGAIDRTFFCWNIDRNEWETVRSQWIDAASEADEFNSQYKAYCD